MLKFMIEIAVDEDEYSDYDYEEIATSAKDQVYEALRDYGLDVLSIKWDKNRGE